MKHYLNAASAASLQAQIAAHRAHLSELRAQRPFRSITSRNVVSLSARRMAKFPLVGVSR